ncbi:MAG: isoleucine--tRNA ligase [Phycisphaerales bacterium]
MSETTPREREASSGRNRYKATLNLPKTDFPMRADLARNEPLTVERWANAGLYDAVQQARTAAEPFVFHDGPPYANGGIHLGHLLNKALKDFVVRSRLMEGRRVEYVPGWDCHGLPIEHKVMTELLKSAEAKRIEALPEDAQRMEIRRRCRESAEGFIELQSKQMRRLLTLADYEHPYLTMDPSYEGAVLEVFAELVAQGIVYRDRKPVHWSIANRTALAEAELEYEDRDDPSVFVEFDAIDRDAVSKALEVELEVTPTFMIWTTTPWTLPANRGIAVGPRLRYVLANLDGSETIVAEALLAQVAKAVGCENPQVLAACDGEALVGLAYRHPFTDHVGKVVPANYVSLEDGTGLVHTAPGHGREDYLTGLAEGLEVYCPVREDGTFDETAPEWLRGRSVWEGNKLVVETLERSGHLAAAVSIRHSYPHDWRSKTPVIFRATEQWFVAVDRPLARDGRTLRDLAVSGAAEISFVPEWGRNRFRGMLESRPDWCISRQRAWGLPIPAFRDRHGAILMTPASVRAVAKAFREGGSDRWFTDSPTQLLAAYDAAGDADCPPGLDLASLEKLHDIFDVWFESGSSWNAVLRERGIGYPAALYLEGSDQHRGWFQLSMLPALAATGEAPFRTLLTHGFIVDRDGRKMSKSGGNALSVDDLLKDFGAEVCRWWVSSITYDGDVKADPELFRLAGESYRKVRNTLRFLLSNLFDAPPGSLPAATSIDPRSIDGWVLGELAALERTVRESFARFDFRAGHQAIYDFCNETLSATYCVAVKDRLYCDHPDSPRRRGSQAAIEEVVEGLVRMLAPILPHTADEALRCRHGEQSPNAATLSHRGFSFSADAGWSKVMTTRDEVLRALEQAKERGIENPLDAGVVLPDPQGSLAPFLPELADLFGVSRVQLGPSAESISIDDLREAPRCERSWKRDGTVRERSDGGLLSDRDAVAVGV